MHQICNTPTRGVERGGRRSWRRWAIAAQALAGAATLATAAGATNAPGVVMTDAAKLTYLKSHMANVRQWKPTTLQTPPSSKAARIAAAIGR